MNNIFIFPFSGASYSGKTTTIEILSKFLKDNNIFPGFEIIIFGEEIRHIIVQKFQNKTIDEIRAVTSDYLKLEEEVIDYYINRENNILNLENKIILQDRALTDVLFYLENYINKTDLTEIEASKYCLLQNKLIQYLNQHFINNYAKVFEFKPICSAEKTDPLRPATINILKDYEYACIHRLNNYYSMHNKFDHIYDIDLNEVFLYDKAYDLIIKLCYIIRNVLITTGIDIDPMIQTFSWENNLNNTINNLKSYKEIL